ncbi:aspartate/glutamate racemase family protein [Qiania dongpingensis]|uniref:Amino acid racemase n=1 Tax=Qiania dongpingensis TaxID=2763669 RepID=A0A7G9G6D5_9FIRM|nr:amino acid racemase [Qiania dongpingensis]QNM06367.1 amino acid racemase [Qiania dongpingensis]
MAEERKFRKLGLVGGMGPESTILYYHGIVYETQKRAGRQMFPDLLIESVNVFEVLECCQRKEYEKLTCYLLRAIENLASGGAEFAALSANTAHIVFDELKKRSPIPLVSIVEAACEEAERRELTKIGLLGTKFTMEGTFFRKPFLEKRIEITVPNEREREYVNRKISEELEAGIIIDETRRHFMDIIRRMTKEEGIEAVVLGCTELPLLFDGVSGNIEFLDTVEIHIRTLVDRIVGTSDKKGEDRHGGAL